jgi:serine/threonine protein phosphatase PrpC
MALFVTHHSEAGGHAESEDSVSIGSPAGRTEENAVLVTLADGQGGQPGGEPAARLASGLALEMAQKWSPDQVRARLSWSSLLRQVDDRVARDEHSGYCTLIGALIEPNGLVGASSGDSAVVAFTNARGMIELTARQRKNPPVGSGMAIFTPFAQQLAPPWTVLLMSDGVWKYTGWDALRQLDWRQPGESIIRSLRQKAELAGSGRLQDDFTLVVVQGQAANAPRTIP